VAPWRTSLSSLWVKIQDEKLLEFLASLALRRVGNVNGHESPVPEQLANFGMIVKRENEFAFERTQALIEL
jgi:hypothetical protein